MKIWANGTIAQSFKMMANPLLCSSYKGVKQIEQALRVFEKVVARRLRIKYKQLRLWFMPGRSKTEVICILRHCQRKGNCIMFL